MLLNGSQLGTYLLIKPLRGKRPFSGWHAKSAATSNRIMVK